MSLQPLEIRGEPHSPPGPASSVPFSRPSQSTCIAGYSGVCISALATLALSRLEQMMGEDLHPAQTQGRMHRAVDSVSPVGWKLGTPMSSVPNESLCRGTDRPGRAHLTSLGHLPQQLLRSQPLLRRTIYRLLFRCDCLTSAQLCGFDIAPFYTAARLLPFQSAQLSSPHYPRQTKKKATTT